MLQQILDSNRLIELESVFCAPVQMYPSAVFLISLSLFPCFQGAAWPPLSLSAKCISPRNTKRLNVLRFDIKGCVFVTRYEEHGVIPDRSSLLKLVAQGGHGSLHALVLLPLPLQNRSLGFDLLNNLIQHFAHSPGLLLLQLELRLTLGIRIVQLRQEQRRETYWCCNRDSLY